MLDALRRTCCMSCLTPNGQWQTSHWVALGFAPCSRQLPPVARNRASLLATNAAKGCHIHCLPACQTRPYTNSSAAGRRAHKPRPQAPPVLPVSGDAAAGSERAAERPTGDGERAGERTEEAEGRREGARERTLPTRSHKEERGVIGPGRGFE